MGRFIRLTWIVQRFKAARKRWRANVNEPLHHVPLSIDSVDIGFFDLVSCFSEAVFVFLQLPFDKVTTSHLDDMRGMFH